MKRILKKILRKIVLNLVGLISYLNRLMIFDKVIYFSHHHVEGNIENLYAKRPGRVYLSKRCKKPIGQNIADEDLYSLKKVFNYIPLICDLIFSRVIVLDDSLVALGAFNFSKKQRIIQVWHACGAFKKFGFASHHNTNKSESIFKMYEKYSGVIVSSDEVRKHYAKSFSLGIDKIKALGVPRTDVFYNEEKINILRDSFFKTHPWLKGKKIFLYAPTYRKSEFIHKEAMDSISKIQEVLKENEVLIYSLHPFDQDVIIQGLPENCNFTRNCDSNTLLLVADVLITDYSSVIFEFSLMNKPMIFYSYDLESYVEEQRGFYYDYESFVPGPIAKDIDELKVIIDRDKYDYDQILSFKNMFMSACDGHSTDRVVEYIDERK